MQVTLAQLLLLLLHAAATLLEDREVVCSSERMVVNLSFLKPFHGVVFARDQFRRAECRWPGNGGHYLLVAVPLDYNSTAEAEAEPGTGFCGLSFDRRTGEHSLTLIISPDAVVLTEEALSLATRCVQSMEDVMITLEAPAFESNFKLARTESMTVESSGSQKGPSLRLKLLSDHGIKGDQVSEASVGQRITMDVELEDTSLFDMYVHDCTAHDGTHSADASIGIVDANGCALKLLRAIDPPVFSSSPQQGVPKHVYVHIYGFQFTSSEFVHFECKVTTCVHECPMKAMQMQERLLQHCWEPSAAALVLAGSALVFLLLAYFTRKLVRSYYEFVEQRR